MTVGNMHKQKNRIPIFPLGVVLLPGMTMPLHIFEERYKIMVRECLDLHKPFGIVYFDGKRIHRIGCTATILEVSRRYEDGRMDIVVQWVQRFHMDQLDDSHAYLMSGVHYMDDVVESQGLELKALGEKNVDLLRRLDGLSGFSGEEKQFDDADLKRLSFLVPGTEGFSLEERQRFLEMTSARERLEKGLKVLEKVIARAKISREITELIEGNGHLQLFLAEKGRQV